MTVGLPDPAAPPDPAASGDAVPSVSPVELKEMLDRGDPIDLIDIREPWEWEIVHIPGARRVPEAEWLDGSAFAGLDPARRPVFYCRTGHRTLDVLAAARRAGVTGAVHLDGGVVAWVNRVDPTKPVY